MSLFVLLAFFCEFSTPVLELVEQEVIQYNLFEKVDTLCLSFNGFIVLRLYKLHVEQLYLKFKTELDERIALSHTPAQTIRWLNELAFGIKELERKYYKEAVGSKCVYLHDMLYLDACLTEQQEVRLKWKVSEFLLAQRNVMRMAKEFISLRIAQRQELLASVSLLPNQQVEKITANEEEQLEWAANDTDLLELSSSLYESRVVKTRSGSKLTKKALLSGLEQLFHIKVENADVKLSKALLRKVEPAPFLTRLKDNFVEYVENRINR